MGELKIADFTKNDKTIRVPISPFEKKVLKNNFTQQSKFSTNGVVEYTTGVKPRDDVGVLSKVKLHVAPMERTILKAFPEKNLKQNRDDSFQEMLSGLGYLELVQLIDDSDTNDWMENPEEYLAVIDEVKSRDLDEEEE